MTITIEKLSEIMASQEGERLEFKEARNNYQFDKLVKYCAAIANEGSRGRPWFGLCVHYKIP